LKIGSHLPKLLTNNQVCRFFELWRQGGTNVHLSTQIIRM